MAHMSQSIRDRFCIFVQPWFQEGMGSFIIFLFYHITQTDLIHPMFNSLMIQAWEWTPSFPT